MRPWRSFHNRARFAHMVFTHTNRSRAKAEVFSLPQCPQLCCLPPCSVNCKAVVLSLKACRGHVAAHIEASESICGKNKVLYACSPPSLRLAATPNPTNRRALDYAAGESGTCNVSAIILCNIIAARLMDLVLEICTLLCLGRPKISDFHIAHRGQ